MGAFVASNCSLSFKKFSLNSKCTPSRRSRTWLLRKSMTLEITRFSNICLRASYRWTVQPVWLHHFMRRSVFCGLPVCLWYLWLLSCDGWYWSNSWRSKPCGKMSCIIWILYLSWNEDAVKREVDHSWRMNAMAISVMTKPGLYKQACSCIYVTHVHFKFVWTMAVCFATKGRKVGKCCENRLAERLNTSFCWNRKNKNSTLPSACGSLQPMPTDFVGIYAYDFELCFVNCPYQYTKVLTICVDNKHLCHQEIIISLKMFIKILNQNV